MASEVIYMLQSTQGYVIASKNTEDIKQNDIPTISKHYCCPIINSQAILNTCITAHEAEAAIVVVIATALIILYHVPQQFTWFQELIRISTCRVFGSKYLTKL